MRLLITAESAAQGGKRRDLILDYDENTTVADLARTLATALSEQPATASRPANVVDLRSRGDRTETLQSLELFLGDELLDPTALITATDIRQAATIGVGGPSSHRAREPRGVAEVRITSGRGAGRVHRLGIGTATIGTAAHCTVTIEDTSAPEVAVTVEVDQHGAVTVAPDPDAADREIEHPHRREPAHEPIVLGASRMTDIRRGWLGRLFRRKPKRRGLELGERVDPADPLPMVRLDRVALVEPTTWEPGHVLGIGDVLLEHVGVSQPDASLSPAESRPELDYNRPPRLHPAEQPNEFALPMEPRKPDKAPIPLVMMLSPLAMSGSMYAMTRSPYSLIIMILMPMMMLLNASGSRRQQHKRWLASMEEYHEKRVNVERAAIDSLVDERALRRSGMPDPASLLLFATGPRARLWERRRWDADFLTLRLGTSDLPANVVVKDPERAQHEGPLQWTSPDVPVQVPLPAAGVLGLAGEIDRCRQVTSWLVAQIATLHSPTDAELWILTDAGGESAWDWSKWLPHVRGSEGRRPVRVGFDEDSRSGMLAELGSIAAARRELREEERAGLPRLTVILDGARGLRLLPGMISLLKDGPSLAMYFICLDRTVHELPEECRSVVEVGPQHLNLETTAERHIDGIRPDLVDAAWLIRLARALAPIRDVSTEDLSASLPTSSRLLDVLTLSEPDGESVQQRWSQGGRTTHATIGEGLDGPFTIDIRADGPHGLVAGTTGSGKSELLQTIIASLAVGNRPDEFTFVLVDYKGGAAFMDCQHLPHTVGMVTDLDGHLTSRALESLGAELHHREHQLARAQAKDIEDYLAGRGPGDEPMPRLLIVIDEFAALVAELPDFVTGLVDVARRGRSLGVHLILATQRPAGVVNAEIKSNTNLRIALRVTDAGDSDDVIESPVAAEIPKSAPGRAYARLGASSLIPFQSSRVGGRPPRTEKADVVTMPFEWNDLPHAGVRPRSDGGDEGVEVPTDLATLVGAIRDANDRIGLGPMRKPWLPALTTTLRLDALDLADAEAGVVPPIAIGMADLPHQQQQVVESWDLQTQGHLMIAGQSRSGRSTALRAVAASIGHQTSPADVHLYGIDAGNNALLPLISLPHTGAVVTRSQTDRMNRLFDFLAREMTRRQQVLAESGFADIAEQRQNAPVDERMPYLVVLLDRLEGFTAAFENLDGGRLVERLNSLLQEGAGVGLRLVIAADRSGILGRISVLVEDRIMLSMNDPGDFSAIGLNGRDVPTVMPPGRAFRAGERPREMQWALLDDSGVGTDQVRALHELGRDASERWADVAKHRLPRRVDDLPTAITLDDARELDPASPSPTFVPVGVGGDTLALQGFDPLVNGSGFLIVGPPRSGRSNALLAAARTLIDAGGPVVAFAPRISPLRDLDAPNVTVFTGEEPIDEVKSALRRAGRSFTILVDDFDVLGTDSPMASEISDAFASMRDSDSMLILAGGADELSSSYRGLHVDVKRGRTGLILAPRGSSDGELVNARLPRSVGDAVPLGRAILADTSGWRWVQVPKV